MDPSDELLAARDLVADWGWKQGGGIDPGHPICIGNAVVQAYIEAHGQVTDRGIRAMDYLRDYCMARYNKTVVTVNDIFLSSEDDAIEVLEGAAKWTAERREDGSK